MPAYPATHTVRFNGPSYTAGTNISITLVAPGTVSADAGDISDGADDIWTNNETVSEVANSTVFFVTDATYVGTISVSGFGNYPVFEQFGFYTAVFGNHAGGLTGFNAATQAVADATGSSLTIDASSSFVACFAEGTMIETPSGQVAVESLSIGDPVLTADGRSVPLRWVGHQDLFPSNVTQHMQPVRIRAGALGKDLPAKDLIVTADHAIYLDGYLVDAAALVNRDTIDFLPLSECGFRLTVYHLETEAHEVIIANGLTAESFLDQPSRASFDNFAEYEEIYGQERRIPEMAVPRIPSARMLPPEIRARLQVDYSKAPLKKSA